MSRIVEEVAAANRTYANNFGEKGKLPLPPARGFAILTCMDARLDPAKYAGLAEGDAHVIRNAGGRATDDAIRSLVISYKLLGTKEWFVIHHSDCGMELFTDDIMAGLLDKSLETAKMDEKGWHDVGKGPGFGARAFHQVAHDLQFGAKRGRGCETHPQPSTGPSSHTTLWLYLRRAQRPPRGGKGRDNGRPINLNTVELRELVNTSARGACPS